MFRYFFSGRVTLATLAFFVLVVGGSLLYYWDTLNATENERQRHNQFLQELENRGTKPGTSTGHATPIESAVSTKQGPDTADATNTVQAQPKTSTNMSQNKSLSEVRDSNIGAEILAEEEKAEMHVSPHGFGPYPEIPPDFPVQDIFRDPRSASSELRDRVYVKLWKQGVRPDGITVRYDAGLVYPVVRGTVYLKWRVLASGKRYAGRISGHPATVSSLRERSSGRLGIIFEEDIPPSIEVLDYSEGINPYEFLDLP